MTEPYDIFKSIIDVMPSNPRFMSDNWNGVANIMARLHNDKSQDGSHYPLIVLDSNYAPDSGDILGVSEYWTAKFYFIDRTDKSYTVEQRNELSYKANIYPLINEFLYFMFRSTKVVFDTEPLPMAFINSRGEYKVNLKHKLEKLPFLKGKDLKQNQLNAIVDAASVEIDIKIRNYEQI